jgi:hypothetical protein
MSQFCHIFGLVHGKQAVDLGFSKGEIELALQPITLKADVIAQVMEQRLAAAENVVIKGQDTFGTRPKEMLISSSPFHFLPPYQSGATNNRSIFWQYIMVAARLKSYRNDM